MSMKLGWAVVIQCNDDVVSVDLYDTETAARQSLLERVANVWNKESVAFAALDSKSASWTANNNDDVKITVAGTFKAEDDWDE